jgi:hypothetical protein
MAHTDGNRIRRGALGGGDVVIALQQAEIAMGSSARIMEEYQFQRKMGWHHLWTIEGAIKRATKHPDVVALIWC